MKRIGLTLMSVLVMMAVVGSPVWAAKKKATGPSCKQIKDAMASGKTADEVEKDLNVTAARVKSCTTPAKHRKTMHKAS